MSHDFPANLEDVAFSTRSARRINGEIADWLGRQIVSGQLSEGAAVPREIEFCDRTGISRGAYREALRVLAAKGMLVSKTRTGTRVAPRDKWTMLDADVVRWNFELGKPADWFIRALYELRTMIEPPAAAFAAERRTEEDLQAFRKALHAMRTCEMTEDSWHQADAGFHRAILVSSHNPVLLSLEAGISSAVAYTTAFRYRDMPNPHTRNPVAEHAAVFERIEARDAAGARRLMSELVDTALLDSKGTTVFDLGLPTIR
ncbi:FadR family transcriptional regulator [Pseudooceanicola sediminis]|uniref:FadR family transcriptional regulator n=1 Tax=Pseudooceanicola sediminis TaxID=2211117 RepID=A0A399IUT8_9RHOB|nr:FadR/GntR family transcriptional regulator [Pseudooceanicola sediminis]RII36905.1 FadR family transcriptional regulator [Pseudooceanicola sediminis]|tara:strand:+ start:70397 stop:71173 length:777 start_codon:yes stop_codon:yes gene_type:complete